MNNIPQRCFATVIAGVLAAASTGFVQADEHVEHKGSDKMMARMQQGMQDIHIIKLSGDVDKDFATMMKMHHEQGIEMAKIEVADGRSPEMKKMAQKMIAAQKKEIAEFEKWLSKHDK